MFLQNINFQVPPSTCVYANSIYTKLKILFVKKNEYLLKLLTIRMPKIVKNIRVHIQFCSLQANLIESIRFVNNYSSIFCSRASIFKASKIKRVNNVFTGLLLQEHLMQAVLSRTQCIIRMPFYKNQQLHSTCLTPLLEQQQTPYVLQHPRV